MKKIIINLLAIVLMSGLWGCTKLDENPVGLLSPDGFFKTKKDVQAAVYGINGVLAHESLFGRAYLTTLMLRDDMSDIGNRSTALDRINVNDFAVNSTNGLINQIWTQFYVVISCANNAEAGAKSLGLADSEINPLIAEARFGRAFSYFHLVRVFGDLPYIDFVVADPDSVKTISRTKEADVYKSIIADLEFAKQWLPDKQTSDCRTRPSKGTAASYLASVYLTLKDYPKAYTEAKYVIDNKALFGYELAPDYQNLYNAATANVLKETIYAIDFLGVQNLGSYNDDLMATMTAAQPWFNKSGFDVIVPSLKVYESFNTLDYRKKVSFDTVYAGVYYTNWVAFAKRPHIAKWSRFPGNNTNGRYTDHNYPDMRYAEVLLIAAEAIGENTGSNTEAEGYVNQVRARARNAAGVMGTYPADVPGGLDKTSFINLVLEERRIELAFEWKRWFDIKRRNLGDAVFKGANSLETHANFDASRDYFFPIPKTELDVNPNLGPQNTGY